MEEHDKEERESRDVETEQSDTGEDDVEGHGSEAPRETVKDEDGDD